MLIALLTVLLNVVNTSGEYLLGRYVVEQAQALHGAGPEGAAARQVFIGETYSRLFSTVNLVGFLLQMFVVSRVFKYLGRGQGALHPPAGRDHRIRTVPDRSVAVADDRGEGGRQQPRLLAGQHHQAGTLVADQS